MTLIDQSFDFDAAPATAPVTRAFLVFGCFWLFQSRINFKGDGPTRGQESCSQPSSNRQEELRGQGPPRSPRQQSPFLAIDRRPWWVLFFLTACWPRRESHEASDCGTPCPSGGERGVPPGLELLLVHVVRGGRARHGRAHALPDPGAVGAVGLVLLRLVVRGRGGVVRVLVPGRVEGLPHRPGLLQVHHLGGPMQAC